MAPTPQPLLALVVVVVEFTVFEVELEVGRGGVEEDQIDIEREQVSCGEEHRLLQLLKRFEEEVHRPVAAIGIDLVEPADVHIVADPAGHLELRGRRQRP